MYYFGVTDRLTIVWEQLQIIVCADGAAGINFEHTGVDGHTVLRYVVNLAPFLSRSRGT